MKKNSYRKTQLISLIVTLCLLLALMAGCTASQQVQEDESPQSEASEPIQEAPQEAPEPSEEEASVPEEPAEAPEPEPEKQSAFQGDHIAAPENDMELPICQEVVTYDLFFSFPPPLAETIDSLMYGPALEELTKRTNVAIEFYAISAAVASERYSIMLASGDYPAILQDLESNYSAGLDAAIADGIIYDHKQLIEDYIPIYADVLSASEDIRLALTTSDGHIAGITRLYKEPSKAKLGNIIRQDWLDSTGLAVPETVDQLTEVLRAFKTELNVPEPYYLNAAGYSSNFTLLGAFGTNYTYFHDGDEVKFGPIQEGMKGYLELMNQWYTEGLVSSDYFSNTSQYPSSGDVAKGSIGVFLQEDSILQDIYGYVADENSSLELKAVPSLILEEGQTNHFGTGFGDWTGGTTWSISSNCQDPEPLCKMINYLFTQEGSLLANYGVEGISCAFDENGTPYVTETITANPEMGNNEAQLKYTLPFAPFVEDYARFNTGYTEDQLQAPIIWQTNADKACTLPDGLTMSSEYNEEYNSIYNDISTYVSESINQFITGARPISEFDDYVAQVEALGIGRCVEIWQLLYNEYNNK